MKTAEVSNLQGVLFDEVVTIVRGSTSFSISKYELDDLIVVLQRLSADMSLEPGAPSPVTTSPAAATRTVAPRTAATPSTSDSRPSRSGLWPEMRRYLQSCQRAQGMNSIIRQMKRARVVDGDPTDLVKKVVAERVRSKDVIKTRSGRYTLGRGR